MFNTQEIVILEYQSKIVQKVDLETSLLSNQPCRVDITVFLSILTHIYFTSKTVLIKMHPLKRITQNSWIF